MSPHWDARLETGYRELDDQHRKAFELISEAVAAILEKKPKEEVLEVLHKLLDYFERHTSTEEAIMQAFDFEGLAAHKAEHDSVIAEIRRTIDLYNRVGINSLITVKIQTMLTRWSREHIANHDQKMVDFVMDVIKKG